MPLGADAHGIPSAGLPGGPANAAAFPRAHLIENCLPESDALERVIDSPPIKLRRKLQLAGQDGLIETVRGIGYRLWPWD